jgi:hypothetical protein
MKARDRLFQTAGFFTGNESANSDVSHLTPRTMRRAPAYGVEARKFGHPHSPTDGGRELVLRAENELRREHPASACSPAPVERIEVEACNYSSHYPVFRGGILAGPDAAFAGRR